MSFTTQNWAISADGLALIQQFEGFRETPAQLPDGNWVVGHGHVRIGDAGDPIGRAEARSLLALDLAPVELAVNAAVKTEITQQQFDALVSFAFSIGIEAFENSAVLRRVNTGSFVAAACAMDAWRKSDVGGELQIIDALVRRRAAEKALFLADAPVEASPSVFMRAKLDYAASVLGAPIAYQPAPDVSAVAVLAPKAEPAVRLTEILKSEPATEALLLTQVATIEQIAADEGEDVEAEIVTAHAKPVARRIEITEIALPVDTRFRKAKKEKATKQKRSLLPKFRFDFSHLFDNGGLVALFLFGAGLIALGAYTLLGGRGDAIDIMAASALVVPGLIAVFMSVYGMIKTPALPAHA